MNHAGVRWLLFGLLGLLACSSTYPPGTYPCAQDGTCPSGLVCNTAHVCVAGASNDPHQCGAAKVDCTQLANVSGSAVVCTASGTCDVSAACRPGFGHCTAQASDGCETDLRTSEHCGACDTKCADPTPMCSSGTDGGPQCVSGCSGTQSSCGGMCVDTQTDERNCASCGHACPVPDHGMATCKSATCGYTCASGYHDDGHACQPNTTNECCGPDCRACTAPAGGSVSCDGTNCVPTCPAGQHLDQGACVANNVPSCCGPSCATCPAPAHGSATCDGTFCGFTCDSSFHNTGSGVCAPNDSTTCCGPSCAQCVSPAGGSVSCDGTSCVSACPTNQHVNQGACVANNTTDCCGPACAMCQAPAGGSTSCDGTSCQQSCPADTHLGGGSCLANNTTSCCGPSCVTCSAPTGGTVSCDGMGCVSACPPDQHLSQGACIANNTPDCCGPSCTMCLAPTGGSVSCDGTNCIPACPSGAKLSGMTCLAGCGTQSITWGAGCSGNPTAAVDSGTNATVTNSASGYSGSATFTCNNGTWTYDSGNCAASCTLPWGATLASGASVTAYQSASVPFGSSCVSGMLTCTDGRLSGTSYQYAACTVGQPTYAYSAWSAYGSCSASCGGGTQTRTRTCQRNDGASVDCSLCGGVCTGSQSCNTQACCVSNVGQACDKGYSQTVAGCDVNYGCASFWGIYYNSPNGCDASTAGSAIETPGPTCTYIGFASYDPFHNVPNGSCFNSSAAGYSTPNTYTRVVQGTGCTHSQWVSVPGTISCSGSCQ